MDGQSEVTNRILGVYLRCLAGDRPRSWLRWLSWGEYCYNTSYQTALQATSFRVVFGRDPPSLLWTYAPGVARVAAVDKQLMQRDTFIAEIRKHLLHDKQHRDVEFQVRD
jgi:hypothetical protein